MGEGPGQGLLSVGRRGLAALCPSACLSTLISSTEQVGSHHLWNSCCPWKGPREPTWSSSFPLDGSGASLRRSPPCRLPRTRAGRVRITHT